VSDLISRTLESLRIAAELLLLSALVFSLIALVFKGPEAIAAGKRAARQFRLNMAFYVFDVFFVAPFVALLVAGVRNGVDRLGVGLPVQMWDGVGIYGTFFTVVFLGDFTSYWRHRLEHIPALWPAHAIHHSDPDISWTTLARFHPINRLTTAAIDIGVLALLGFPMWALVANEMVRKYYGEFIHADLSWTYGPAGRLFVSPAMHQWHHARDVVGSGSNFATVFSVFDQAFGTFYLPGRCTVPLGVTEDLGTSLWSQLRFPFVAWAERLRRAPDVAARVER
jgi:sterol desaturase/sphingolipid hydroxylase (fatty acid hydroxylase superfamily)